jgi:signal recognition particle subunit SRP54
MFQTLTDRLSKTFEALRSRGVLTEEDVAAALREIRRALLEADVALPVVKKLLARVQEQAVGAALTKSVKPGDQVVKIVHDALLEVLGQPQPFELRATPPAVVLLCGLQGSGKTTTAAKLAKWLREKQKKTVLLASLDVYRPAAQQQLQELAGRIETPMVDIREGEKPLAITKRALAQAKAEGADVLILDTAGRLELDDTLMDELVAVRDVAGPAATLLVVDALTGQVAVQVAAAFQKAVEITGLVFTRVDGDGRGGAILSVRDITGVPIQFLGMGEGVEALQPYRPDGVADRILDRGDVVALVEKMQAVTEEDDARALEAKLMSGQSLTLNDLKKQLKMMTRMGGLGNMLNLLPGMGKLKDKIDPGKLDDRVIKHQIAIIDSMTRQERLNPHILNAKRRKRIAAGSGTAVADVNKLIKMFEQMNKMTKMMKKMGGAAALKNMLR